MELLTVAKKLSLRVTVRAAIAIHNAQAPNPVSLGGVFIVRFIGQVSVYNELALNDEPSTYLPFVAFRYD